MCPRSENHKKHKSAPMRFAATIKRKLVNATTSLAGSVSTGFVNVGNYVQDHILTQDYLTGIIIGVVLLFIIRQSREGKLGDNVVNVKNSLANYWDSLFGSKPVSELVMVEDVVKLDEVITTTAVVQKDKVKKSAKSALAAADVAQNAMVAHC
jgi:hypothetical protein